MKDNNKYVSIKSLSDNCVVNFGRPNKYSRLEYSLDTVNWQPLPVEGLPLAKKEIVHLKGYNLEFKTITPKEFFKFSGKISFLSDWQGFQYETDDYIQLTSPAQKKSNQRFFGFFNDIADSITNWLSSLIVKPLQPIA